MNVDPELPLDECPVLSLNVQIPLPIKERLEALRKLANKAGAGASLKDIVGALIFSAPEDAKTLSAAVLNYRASPARDATVGSGELGNVLEFHRRPPGRRPRGAAN